MTGDPFSMQQSRFCQTLPTRAQTGGTGMVCRRESQDDQSEHGKITIAKQAATVRAMERRKRATD